VRTLSQARGMSFVLALTLSFGTLGALAPAAAAQEAPYSAPLRTAVRQLVVAPQNTSPYDRDAQFGGDWLDVDGDCLNTRHEVLVAESGVAPTLSSSGCTVTAGSWMTFYDNGTYTSPTEVQIDHMVPVSEAWDSGAQAWTQAQRVAFYNDLGYAFSLNVMVGALNQAKSDRGPEAWLPPANVCQYIEAWTAVKIRWALTVDPTEQAALIQRADACPNDTITVNLAGVTEPTTPTPTTPVPPPATGPAGPPLPDQPGTKRLAGNDRYATAAEIVQDSFPAGPVPVVFIATGTAFADALAGGPAADKLGGPILPIAADGIPAAILAELTRLQPGRIVILGGPGAVSQAIATELDSFTTGTVTRLAGGNRYATAARVATSTFTAPVAQVLIATGASFADALAGGAVGAKTNSPVLLVSKNTLPAETAAALRQLQPRNIAVLGGTGVISDAVASALRPFAVGGGVTRLAGGDRYATAARLAQVFWPTPAPVVYLATGRNFPDALAGVPAAGRDNAPLLLTEPHCMPAATERELDRLRPTTIVVLGGTSTVSAVAAARAPCIVPHVGPPNPGDVVDCDDFASQRDAQAYFNKYFAYYGDVARLDRDGDRIACETAAAAAPVAPRPVASAPAPVAPAPTRPARPADVDCSDFRTQAAAQAFYNRYFPFYGDFARLDGSDNDGRACEGLP
jgi:putative cell wall-binding protein